METRARIRHHCRKHGTLSFPRNVPSRFETERIHENECKNSEKVAMFSQQEWGGENVFHLY